MPPASRVVALVLAACVLAGCGGSGEPSARATPAVTTSAAADDATAAPLPEGWQQVTSPKAGLGFGAPSAWAVVDTSRFDDPDRREIYTEFAEARGLTLDQFRDQLDLVDVFVGSVASAGLDYESVNTTVLTVADLPDEDLVTEVLEGYRATDVAVEDVTTPVGDGRIARYAADLPVLGRAYGFSLYLKPAGGVVNLTMTAMTEERRDELEELLLPTLAELRAAD